LNISQTKLNKKDVLIIGAGGVAQVVAHKCGMHNDVLGEIHIASRTKAKCDEIAQSVHDKNSFKRPATLHTHQVDAMKLYHANRAASRQRLPKLQST